VRGREAFQRVRPALVAASAALRSLPRGVATTLLLLSRHIPTRLGIAVRFIAVRALAKHCGDVVAIHEGVHLFHLEAAEFGDHVSIHPMCYIDAYGGLSIGSHVSIAHGTTIVTTNHDFAPEHHTIRDASVLPAAVRIGDNVWIGAGVRILAGVRIGDGVVVGAGAVVTKDVSPGTVVAGVPARPIKSRSQGHVA